MISHEHRVVFIHIPKCAGTSMENYLKDFQFSADGHTHETHKELLRKKRSKDYYKFSFTRNPFDKMVSEFKWFTDQQNKWNGPACRIYYNNVNFKTFVKKFITAHVGDGYHVLSQYDILIPLEHIDFIGRFENLENDFSDVCNKIGIPWQKLPHINKRKHKHYTEYYDDETREIVAERYAKDIEYFGYKFENL
tara:strand:- start:8 stop:586 length:579 start_codon:yes stop_codon:yes gene_type:complete